GATQARDPLSMIRIGENWEANRWYRVGEIISPTVWQAPADWNGATHYVPGDTVKFGGNYYYAKANSTNVQPIGDPYSGLYWGIIGSTWPSNKPLYRCIVSGLSDDAEPKLPPVNDFL